MARNVLWKVITGPSSSKTINPDASLSTSAVITFAREDIYTDLSNYMNYGVRKPNQGTNYSYERWIQVWWDDNALTTIANVTFYFSGSLVPGLTLRVGVKGVYDTPDNTPRSQTASDTHTTITPASPKSLPIFMDGDVYKSNYIVMQLVVPASVQSTGNISNSSFIIAVDYEEI